MTISSYSKKTLLKKYSATRQDTKEISALGDMWDGQTDGVTGHVFVLSRCIESDDKYSQSRAIHTVIKKGAYAVC